MERVARLVLDEDIRVDGLRLSDIVRELGSSAAEEVIGLALEQLAVSLRDMRRAALGDDWLAVADCANQVARLAWQIGLVSLATVAIDVTECVGRGDVVARAATQGRAQRIGRRSLTELWDHTIFPPVVG